MTLTTIDKKSFRISIGIAIIVILFLIATTANFASWKTGMEDKCLAMSDRLEHAEGHHTSLFEDIEELEDRASERDIQLAEIQTKLANIEVLLIEIKQDIKEK